MSGSIALSRVFFLFICSLGTTLAANCDQDFVYIEGLGCYHVNSEATMNWEDAKDYCAARNSYLVELRHEQEMAEVISLALDTQKDYWIGLSDLEYEGNFLWERSRDTIENFHAWGTDEPNGAYAENCVSITNEHTYFWTDEDCITLRTPLCFGNVLLNPCEEGWRLVGASRTCILVGDGGTTSYGSARSRCEEKGAWLATLEYEAKAEEIKAIVQSTGSGSQGVWFGLTDEAKEGTYVWERTGDICTYFNWGVAQPDSGTRGNCVILYSSGGWNWFDTYCGETNAFNGLCEKDAIGGGF